MNELALEQARILEGVINRMNQSFDENGFPENLDGANNTMLDTKL